MNILIVFFPAALIVGVLATSPAPQSTSTQTIVDTSVCAIAATPGSFDGKLVRVSAFISSGFEDSTLHDYGCAEEALVNMMKPSTSAKPNIWVEFQDEGEHYGVKEFAPLVNDETYQQFRKVVLARSRLDQMTRARMIGTFYSSRPQGFTHDIEPMRGYGHMGCCGLFVLSRVESVETTYANELDYMWGMSIDLPDGCYSEQELSVPTNSEIRRWQRDAVDGLGAWRHDPRQTAEEQLKRIISSGPETRGGTTSLLNPKKEDLKPSNDARPTETLLESSATPNKVRYEYIEANRLTRFVIVVTRPYWLEPTAGSPENVIWAPAASSILRCVAQNSDGEKH
jgi:hypothetical protein